MAVALEQSGSGAVKRTIRVEPNDGEEPTEKIDRYKILQKLGEGGCGVVYMAEQTEPVRRKVALKVIKLGMDTKQVIARFEAERQALALMDHPNIAKVLDAGATATGRPYFVMELVKGIRITDYCDQNHLSTTERLGLFTQICQAIQHAHQKGIIHRDIKPSNILVTLHDGKPVPKVIDFGIAKATEQPLTEKTVFTAFGQFMGTPAYMSPEQAELSGLDIDTRSDIYALGVLLYELLTGKTPFDAKDLLQAGLDEMRRRIREEEPMRPSTRLSTMVDADLTEVAEQRRSEPGKLTRFIRGDLDWIVMKCLEKDRTRRYETANGLATDIRRHLENEPVLACPPSTAYRFQKMVRRNKVMVSATAVVFVVLLLGVVVSTSQAIRATSAKAQALAEKRRADDEAAKQEAVNRFLNEMLASADPDHLSANDQTKGRNITIVEVLDEAARQLDAGSLKERPAIEAAIRQTLGRTYLNLDHPESAETHLLRALKLNQQIYGELSDNTIESLTDMSFLRGRQNHTLQSEKLMREIIAKEQQLHGKEHPHVALALIRLADILVAQCKGGSEMGTDVNMKKIVEAEASYREAMAMQRRLLPRESLDLSYSLTGLANLMVTFLLNDVEAEPLLREALQIQTTVLGPKHLATVSTMLTLAQLLNRKQQYGDAQRLCEQAVKIQRELLGPTHVSMADSLCALGDVLLHQQKLPESEAVLREALPIIRRAYPGSLNVAFWLNVLAGNLVAQKRFSEAEVMLREELQIWETYRYGGVGCETYWIDLDTLINVLKSDGRPADVEALCRDVLDRQRQALGDQHVVVPAMLCRLGDFQASRNKTNEAAKLFQQALDLIPKLSDAGHNRVAMLSLAGSLRSRGRSANAEKLYEVLISAENQKPESPNYFLGALLQDYGDLLWNEGKPAAAVEQYLRSLPIRRIIQNDGVAWTLSALGGALLQCSRPKEAELYLRESLDSYRKLHQQDNLYGTAWPTRCLADALYQQNRLPEAEQAYRDALSLYVKCNGVGDSGFPEVVQPLVEILTSENRLADAESILNGVLTTERQLYGQKNIKGIPTLLELVVCVNSQSKPDKATESRREVAEIITNSAAEDLLGLPPEVISLMIDAGLKPEATDVCNKILTLPQTNASWLNSASWTLVIAEKPTARDAALAVKLAQSAVGLDPKKRNFRNTLGAAFYRAGDWRGAVTELERAETLNNDNQRKLEHFFLAMAYHRLGETEVARRHYSQAVSWMADLPTPDKEALRLRSEAVAVLEVKAAGQMQETSPTPGAIK
jgi:eukaryotic-like serine/threonine-protein kinase